MAYHNKDNIEIIAGNKEKYISFNAKIKIKQARFTNKDGKEARWKFSLGSYIVPDLWHQFQANWKAIYVIKRKFNRINVKVIWCWQIIITSTLLGCKRCKTKDEREVKRNFDHCSWHWNWDEQILLDDSKRCVPIRLNE